MQNGSIVLTASIASGFSIISIIGNELQCGTTVGVQYAALLMQNITAQAISVSNNIFLNAFSGGGNPGLSLHNVSDVMVSANIFKTGLGGAISIDSATSGFIGLNDVYATVPLGFSTNSFNYNILATWIQSTVYADPFALELTARSTGSASFSWTLAAYIDSASFVSIVLTCTPFTSISGAGVVTATFTGAATSGTVTGLTTNATYSVVASAQTNLGITSGLNSAGRFFFVSL
jgi:hypothetical protein